MLLKLFFLGNIEADAIEMSLTLQFGEQLGFDRHPFHASVLADKPVFIMYRISVQQLAAQFVSHHGQILRMNDCRHPVPHGGKLFPGITYIFK